jgi:NADH-quinone oxidoreductase subunit M
MPILTVSTLLPLAAAAVLVLLPRRAETAGRWIAAATALALLIFSALIFWGFDSRAGGFQYEERARWLDALGITWHLAVDGISVPLLLLTGLVIFTGVFVSWKIHYRPNQFLLLLLVLVAGVVGTFVAVDLFWLFFFYELAVLPMYLLIAVWGSTRKEYGAMKLTLMLVAGSVLIWITLIAMYLDAGAQSFDLFYLRQHTFSPEFQRLFFPFLMVGFGVLAGLWPFHTWSPDGHVAAPTAVSMLHAGVLMKLGAYGIIRVGVDLLPLGAQAWAPVLIVLATVNVLYGAFSAMAQRDLKFVIGYSSVSHMGYVLMGIATLSAVGLTGAVLQMFSHGVMTALFFALVGTIYDGAHTREIAAFRGLAHRMPAVATLFTIAGLASLGLPGLSGFVAELLVFIGTFQTYPVLGAFAVIGVAVTATYILRLLGRVFFGPLDPQWAKLPDSQPSELFGQVILAAFLFIVGLFPFPFIRVIESGVLPLVRRVGGIE